MRKFLNLSLILTFVSFLISCTEDEDHGLTANAGPDQEVTVGQTVQLSSANSIDLNGEGFESRWDLVAIPAGSTVQLNDPLSAMASFIPDIPGDYLVRLTIVNAIGRSSDDVVVRALPAQTIEIGGSHNEDLHLTNIIEDPDVPDYIVTSNLSVSARLIIDPGVRIAVGSDRQIRVTSNGVINVNGTATEPVVIVGSSPLPGFWRGLLVESNNLENEISHLHLSHSGSNNVTAGAPRAGMHLGSARVNLNHSRFTDIDGFGVSVSQTSSRVPMQNNFFDNNTLGAMQMTAAQIGDVDALTDFNAQDIVITGSNIAAGTDHTWGAANNGTYRFTSNVDISANTTITEGAVFTFDNNVLLRFRSDATVKVLGTASDPVIFKGSLEQPGSWRGIVLESSTLENLIQHAEFAHAGHSNLVAGFGRAALGFASNTRATITNSHFRDIDGYGIYIRSNDISVVFDTNSFGSGLTAGAVYMHANSIKDLDSDSDFGGNYVIVDGGSVTSGNNHTWPSLNNGKYLFTSNVDNSGRVNIDAGAILEFESNILLRFRDIVTANGTSTNPVVFTRRSGTNSHWRGLTIESSSNENLMEYVEVSYGGNSTLMAGFGQTNIGLSNNARLTLNNSIVSNSLGYGVYLRSGAILTQSGTTFSNNASGDIHE